jgi:hypothetical protein
VSGARVEAIRYTDCSANPVIDILKEIRVRANSRQCSNLLARNTRESQFAPVLQFAGAW